MPVPEPNDVRSRIERIVLDSAEGGLSEDQLADAGGSLPRLSYSSLSYIRMIDAVENELGVYLDPEERDERYRSVDGLVELVTEALRDPADA
jgi:acyl carrier protein